MKSKKLIGRIHRTLGVIILLALTFSSLPSMVFDQIGLNKLARETEIPIARAAVGDGVFIYDQTIPTTNVQQRAWTQSTATVGSASSPFAGSGTAKHVFVKSSPTREEFLLGIQDSAGTLTVYKSTDGTTWVSQWTVTVGDGNLRRFEMAYEQTSGDALVVYSGNVATDGQELKYYTWNGSTWTGPTNLGSARTTGTVYGIKMEERSGSNEIGLVYADTNFDLSANLWTGSAWFGEPSVVLSASISKIGTNTVPTNRAYDLTFETLSGDLMVAWGEDAVLDPKYVIKAAGGAWGSIVAPTTFNEEATVLDISSSPLSDKIAAVACTDNGADCDFTVWSGSAWGTTLNDATSGTPVVGDGGNNVNWLVSGVNEVALMTYNDTAAGGLDWASSTNGATPVLQTDDTAAPAIAGAERAAFAKASPNDQAQGMFIFEDANSDIFVKKASLSGTTVTWSSPTGAGSAIEANASVVGFNPIGFAYSKFVSQTLTIGATAGSKVATKASGTTNQRLNDTACTTSSTCSAFTLSLNAGSDTVTSIKLTETGTVNATNNLSNVILYYDTDENYANGVTGQYGIQVNAFTTETVTFSGSLAISAGTTYYFYTSLWLLKGSTYPKGGETINLQIAATADVVVSGISTKTGTPSLAGTTTVIPNITSVSNGTGLTDGARSGESVTISGYGFGVALAGADRSNCAGAVDTGCVRFLGSAPATVDNTNISAWSNTSITLTINSALVSYGSSSNSAAVHSGSQQGTWTSAYYIYPNITGMTTCASGGNRDSACGTNAALEYSGADTFGLIQLNGDHFGTTAGTISFATGFGGVSGFTHSTVEGACSVAGWGSTGNGVSICIQVSSSISNTVYDGTVQITRGSDGRTHSIDLHILPRIVSNTPVADVVGNVIQIDGDHFCQTGTCPTTPPDTDYKAYFGSTQALSSDFATTPNCIGAAKFSHTQVCVKVPTGTAPGSQKTKIQGKTTPLYESNRKDFTIQSTVPNNPVLTIPPQRQFKADNTTTIAAGAKTNENQVYLKADISASLAINMRLQIEVQSLGTAFTCTGTNAIGVGGCAAYTGGSGALEGTVVGAGGCDACTGASQVQINFTGLTETGLYAGAKIWQARVRNSTTNEYSNWVTYSSIHGGLTDFTVDTIGPAITNISSGTPGTNSATITWDTSVEPGSTQVQYNKTGTFVTNCATNNDCTTLSDTSPRIYNHSVPLNNLDSATTYYYRVRSADDIGNETISAVNTFTTGSVTQPAKTTSFFIVGNQTFIAGGGSLVPTFSVLTPETSPSVKNAFVEITGISNSGGTNNISIQVNSQAALSYTINASAKTHFKIIYEVTSGNLNLNDTPTINTLTISPSLDLYISSAKIIATYAYTP